MKTNRDVTRQNKASSVVDATLYSFIADDATKTVKSLASTSCVTSSPNPTSHTTCTTCQGNKRKLECISNLADTILQSNNVQRSKYMKCSTYLKTGASRLAKTEHNAMKRAIKYNVSPILKDRTKHITTHMVKLQSGIMSNQIGKPPCTTNQSRTESSPPPHLIHCHMIVHHQSLHHTHH